MHFGSFPPSAADETTPNKPTITGFPRLFYEYINNYQASTSTLIYMVSTSDLLVIYPREIERSHPAPNITRAQSSSHIPVFSENIKREKLNIVEFRDYGEKLHIRYTVAPKCPLKI